MISDVQFVKIAKALADPTRHRMLEQIRAHGELNCSQILERFALSQPTISHHIKMLAAAGLVSCRKQGQYHVMTVDEAVLGGFAKRLTGPGKARVSAAGRAPAPPPLPPAAPSAGPSPRVRRSASAARKAGRRGRPTPRNRRGDA